MKRYYGILITLVLLTATAMTQPMPGSLQQLWEDTKDKDVTPNPRTLIIYRPQNNGTINDVRCFLRLEDENGNDVTKTSCTAAYEWITDNMLRRPGLGQPGTTSFSNIFQRDPRNLITYKRNYFLSGAMAMHMNLKPGRYKISFYTPVDQQFNFEYPTEGPRPFEWKSNVFEYDTANPTTVIFVSPTTNDNGFYNGGWYIDYKSPSYIKNRTIPKME